MQLRQARGVRSAEFALLALFLLSLVSCGDDSSTDPVDPTTGSIAVSANVAGASILVGGVDSGKTTDATLSDLDPGTYIVSVVLEDYSVAPASIEVAVEAGKTKDAAFTLTLINQGSIAVVSDVAGALIFLDGAATALTTPDTLSGLSPGIHEVRVELAGYTAAPSSTDLSVVRDSTSDASFALSAAVPQSRKVIVEHFSNTSCEPCLEPDLALEEAVRTIGNATVATMGVHLNWPSPADRFYLANLSQNVERGNQFGVVALPEFRIDGEHFDEPENEPALRSAINAAALVAPKYDIVATYAFTGDSIVVSGSVYKREEITGSDRLYAVIIETDIDFDAPNGLDHFNDIARRYLPGTNGALLDLAAGDTQVFRFARLLSAGWVTGNLEVVVFVESASSRVIYQGASAR